MSEQANLHLSSVCLLKLRDCKLMYHLLGNIASCNVSATSFVDCTKVGLDVKDPGSEA